MKTFLFIHGTGVRETSYSASFQTVQAALNEAFGPVSVRTEPCYWGGNCGSTLFLGGLSVPDFDMSRRLAEGGDADGMRGLWAALYENPAAELEALALKEGRAPSVPGREPPGAVLKTAFERLWPQLPLLGGPHAERLRTCLAEAGLLAHVPAAHRRIAQWESFRRALAGAAPPLAEYRFALARALLAESLEGAWEEGTIEQGQLLFDGQRRDEIVELLVAALGGAEAAVWGTGAARRIFARAGTGWFRRRRSNLSEQMAPFGADVIAYQARPKPIRDFIRDKVGQAARAAKARGEPAELYLLAHSLGGIAAFEALVEAPLADVAGLITVGSQAPLLYELDALGTLPLPKDSAGRPSGKAGRLPPHFPSRWLNVYDPDDFLSYRAELIFGRDRVCDVRLDNGQPFPESHSAYWANPKLWRSVSAFIGGRPE